MIGRWVAGVMCGWMWLGLAPWLVGGWEEPHLAIQLKTGKAVQGRVVVEADDGGYLLMQADGALAVIQPEEIESQKEVGEPFAFQSSEEIKQRLLEELPGFRVMATKHYVIAYDTSDAYAKWVGVQFEGLMSRFSQFWTTRKFKVKDPAVPLVALVFRSKESYETYATSEIGDAAKGMLGYYNVKSNRVWIYDLTGVESQLSGGQVVDRFELVNTILSKPEAERSVATILHEAVHQLAYNTGMQTRLAGNPFWVSEGLAIYFESPDFSNGGKGTIGAINRTNLERFQQFLPRREGEGRGLMQLLCDDQRFRQADQQSAAYGESWAFNYFLLERKRDKYVKYLQHLSKLAPLEVQTSRQRIADVEKYLGSIKKLDQEFLEFVR